MERRLSDAEMLLDIAVEMDVPLDDLFAVAERRPALREPLKRRLWQEVPQWRWNQAQRRAENRGKEADAKRKRIDNTLAHIDGLRSGIYLQHLSNPAHLWLLQYCLSGSSRSEFDKLTDELTPEIADAYLAGFRACLLRDDLPTPQAIAITAGQGKHYYVTFPIQAGIALTAEERWVDVVALPEATLRAALCFAVADHVGSHKWFGRLLRARPQLAGEALYDFWRTCLHADGAACPKGLGWLTASETFSGALGRRALDLLREFPNAEASALYALLRIALTLPDAPQVLGLMRGTLDNPDDLSPTSLSFWAAAAYRLAPNAFQPVLEAALAGLPDRDWDQDQPIVSLVTGAHSRSVRAGSSRFLIGWLTTGYAYIERRPSVGMHRLAISEQAPREIESFIDILATDPSPETSKFLAEMRDDPKRASWRDHFAHAAAQQAQRRRQAEYVALDVAQVVQTLNSGPPANLSDLQALTMALLTDIAREMRDGAADGWKVCWNTDQYGRATAPKIENDCRDVLLGQLITRLKPYRATAKPEGHYADDKRADIDVTCGTFVLPIEIKRQMHADIWTAPADQLDRQYARDPASGGHGIYLAFWFGAESALKAPPDGGAKPTSAAELQAALIRHLPSHLGQRIAVIVFDVAKPE